MPDPLEAMARRAEDEPFFLASVLALYARSEKMDDDALAGWLGCPRGDLAALKLCRAPREGAGEESDFQAISARFRVALDRLTQAVQRGRIIRRMREATRGAAGTLLAAREDEGDQA